MPRRIPTPLIPTGEREMGALDREFTARGVAQLLWEQAHWETDEPFPAPDTWEERWWTREAHDLLVDLTPPIDPTEPCPIPEEDLASFRDVVREQAPERRRQAREAAPRDDDERRWSRKVNKRVRAGMAPSEAFEEAHRRLAEWKERTGR